eukprot:s5619_g3.t1
MFWSSDGGQIELLGSESRDRGSKTNSSRAFIASVGTWVQLGAKAVTALSLAGTFLVCVIQERCRVNRITFQDVQFTKDGSPNRSNPYSH